MERLHADMNRLLDFLFREEVLDDQLFMQLHQLQDEATPNFVFEVISIYFRQSEKHLRTLRFMTCGGDGEEGEAPEGSTADDHYYEKMGVYLNQFIGSSSSVGAKRVRNVCVALRTAAENHSRSGCLRLLEVLGFEYYYLKTMVCEYLQLEQQRVLSTAGRNSNN